MKIHPIDVPKFGKKLYDFQKEGVGFLVQKHGRALIADQMGLGKTIQALAYIFLRQRKRPVIIVVPGNLKPHWEREIYACIPNAKVQTIYGRTIQQLWGDIVLINYELIPNQYYLPPKKAFHKSRPIEIPRTGWVDFLIEYKPKILIFDEVHYLVSSKAARTKAAKKLALNVPRIIGLSGTPSKNRAREIDTIVRIIDPKALPPFWETAHRYYGAKHTRWGWKFDGAKNTKEFHKLLTSSVMLRRKKKDVLKELPPKVRTVIPLEIDNRKEYKEAEQEFIKWLLKKKGILAATKAKNAKQLVKVEMLKQLAVEGKFHNCVNWIRDFLQNEKKLLVFCSHIKTIDRMMKVFGKVAIRYDGTISNIKRDKNLTQFQTNRKIRLLFATIGEGYTATAAAAAAFIELWWNPGKHEQAEDRIHRITQTRGVNIYYLVGLNTIEEKIIKLLDKKRKKLTQILDGKRVKTKSLLTTLLKQTIRENLK